MTDDHDRPAVQPGNATDNCRIVSKQAIAMQLLEVGKDPFHIIERIRTQRVSGQL